jgi:hypothetical protein
MSICRFPSKEDEGYRQVSGEIQILMSTIQGRLDALERAREMTNLQRKAPSETTAGARPYCTSFSAPDDSPK